MYPGVPLGSFLDLILLSLSARSLGSVIHSHGFSHHSYADDTLLIHPCASINLCGTSVDIDTPTQLHLDKTELLFLPGRGSSKPPTVHQY